MPKRNLENNTISDLDYLALESLISEPSYGYAIRQYIIERSEGKIKPSLATLYDVLRRLLNDDLIDRDEDKIIDGRVRRTYQITGLGQRAMSEKEQDR